jgi:lipid-A-disaccharide synthase
MRIYVVAGEASGDLQAAAVMQELKSLDPGIEFRFWGGDRMAAAAGTQPVVHNRERAFMGLWEVLKNLGRIRRYLKQCEDDILAWKPDVLLLVDYPGFNLRMAAVGKKAGIRTIYFIAPKAWAWKKKRAAKLAAQTDLVLSILPFEAEFFQPWGVNLKYIGNPLLDAVRGFQPDPSFRAAYGLESDFIALLPGSREQEIVRILPGMLATAARFPGIRAAVACAPDFPPEWYAERFGNPDNVFFVPYASYDLLATARVALVASGTATLEAALFHCPQVVCYATSKLTYYAARAVLKIRFISLVNIIMDRAVVPEQIQDNMHPDRLEPLLRGLWEGAERERMLSAYRELDTRMGEPGAAKRAAIEIIQCLRA